jgi:putative ABC transport system permease protein
MWAELLFGSLRTEPGRWSLSVAAIALGIALVTAIHTLNHSALAELDQAARVLSGTADLRVEAGRSGFDDSVYARVALTPGIAVASPMIEADTIVAGVKPTRALRVFGIDLFRVAWVQPSLIPKLAENEDRLAALQPDLIFLNEPALKAVDKKLGDNVVLTIATGERSFRIAGTLPDGAGDIPLAVMDIAAVQQYFGQLGRLSRIDLRTVAGQDVASISAALAAQLPPGVHVSRPEQAAQRTNALSRGYRANLTVLALVALFTGGFLVFSMSALSVVKRRTELALLRVLGVTRRELIRRLLIEGVLVGSLGSLLGIALGLLLARAILRIFAANLGAGFFAGVTPALHLDLVVLAVIAIMGVAAGVFGVWVPAREAAHRPPARALKSGDDAVLMGAAPAPGWGLALILLAVPMLLLPPLRGIPLGGYIAIALLLFGTLALLPGLLGAAARRLPSPTQLLPQLSWQQVAAMPGFAVSGLATVIVSFSLVAAMAVMVHSFRVSLDQWLGGVLAADVYVRAPGGMTGNLPDSFADSVAALPDVKSVERLRFRSILLNPEEPSVTLIARDVNERTLEAMTVLARADSTAPPKLPHVWISEAFVARHGAKPGMTLQLPIGDENRSVWVAGIWRDYSRTWGAVIMDRPDYVQATGDQHVNDLALHLASGARPATVIANIRKLPGGERTEIAEATEIRKLSLNVFDRTFAITYALEAAALLVGFAGIAAHFAALAHARRKEFGVLRHLGFRCREIARLLAMEGATLGTLGAGVGLLLGFAISLILIHVVNRQSFHWGMALHTPWLALAVLSAGLILIAALAARLAGQAAMQKSAVLAVRADA